MTTQPPRSEGGFRLILLVGAVVSVVIGVWGLAWTKMLESVLGLLYVSSSTAVARLYGGVMLVVGIGYALASAQPQRSRSMLLLLLLVPLATAMIMIAGVARDEISGGRGISFAVFELAYCLMYFRLYPRLAREPAGSAEALPPDEPST